VENPKYAGFGKRFVAMFGDGIFGIVALSPVWIAQIYGGKWLYCGGNIVNQLLCDGLLIFFLAKWGKSPGKYMANIRVLTVDLKPIGWREALLRHSVQMLLSIAALVMGYRAVAGVSAAEFDSMNFSERAVLQSGSGGFQQFIIGCSLLWTLSEIVFLLFNKKKRALHDFIAGTVVIEEEATAQSAKVFKLGFIVGIAVLLGYFAFIFHVTKDAISTQASLQKEAFDDAKLESYDAKAAPGGKLTVRYEQSGSQAFFYASNGTPAEKTVSLNFPVQENIVFSKLLPFVKRIPPGREAYLLSLKRDKGDKAWKFTYDFTY